jgi:hypothetical protein
VEVTVEESRVSILSFDDDKSSQSTLLPVSTNLPTPTAATPVVAPTKAPVRSTDTYENEWMPDHIHDE